MTTFDARFPKLVTAEGDLATLAGRATTLAHTEKVRPEEVRDLSRWLDRGVDILGAYYREIDRGVRDDALPTVMLRLLRLHTASVQSMSAVALGEIDALRARGVRPPVQRRKFEAPLAKIERLLEDIDDVLALRERAGSPSRPLGDVLAALER